MIDFFRSNFESCMWLAVILISMIPALEARIALPFAFSFLTDWNPISIFFLALFGAMLPVYPAMFFLRKLKGKFSKFYDKNIEKINNLSTKKNKNNLIKLALFVALPLPLTGIWSGSLVAGLTNLKLWQAFLAILAGETLSCLIIWAVCLLFGNAVIYYLYISIAILFIFLIYRAIMRKKANF